MPNGIGWLRIINWQPCTETWSSHPLIRINSNIHNCPQELKSGLLSPNWNTSLGLPNWRRTLDICVCQCNVHFVHKETSAAVSNTLLRDLLGVGFCSHPSFVIKGSKWWTVITWLTEICQRVNEPQGSMVKGKSTRLRTEPAKLNPQHYIAPNFIPFKNRPSTVHIFSESRWVQ
jgi:hypothetical protein